MPFDWSEFLSLARWLQNNTPPNVSPEGAQRTAMSRAYYAAFGYALSYVTQYLGFTPRDESEDHGRLRAHLKQRRRQKTADCLDRLRQWRNECDYLERLTIEPSASLAGALAEADYVYRSLPTPASGPT